MRQQALTHSTELLIERLRFAEARPFLGQLVGWKGLAISQKDFDDLQCIFKSWLAAAAKLWGRELSDRDFHSWMPCFQLSRSPPLRHLSLLERLLTRWCKEEMLENEHEALKLSNKANLQKMLCTANELEQRQRALLLGTPQA